MSSKRKIDEIMGEEGYVRVSDVVDAVGVETSQTVHRRLESGRYAGIMSNGMWWISVASLLKAHEDNPILCKRIRDLGVEPKEASEPPADMAAFVNADTVKDKLT
jgi:hypothetical protein